MAFSFSWLIEVVISCVLVLILLASTSASATKSKSASGVATTYRAAVIEHETVYPLSPITSVADAQAIMNANLDILDVNVHIAAQQKVDIVLFSEMALTSLNFNRDEMYLYLESIPVPNQGQDSIACLNPDFDDRPILQRISCLAKQSDLYLSVNWGDVLPCDPQTDVYCPTVDHRYQFNTQIVFNNKGEVIAKYYKLHTFNCTEFNEPPPFLATNDYITFDLHLAGASVTFGVCTCFDTMYATPILSLIKSQNISNFVMSSWWVNSYASFGAIEWWQAISSRMNINFLAAESYWDQVNPWSSGSGIFSAGHILAQYYNTQANVSAGDTLLIADVPIIPMVNGGGGSAPAMDLPFVTPYLVVDEKHPPPECFRSSPQIWTVSPGLVIHDSVRCTNADTQSADFVCNVSAVISKDTPADNAYRNWRLSVNTGYYHDADGNHVYYHEQFCAFAQLGSGGNHNHNLDDIGFTVFESIALSANYLSDSVQFVMMPDGKGFVYEGIMDQLVIKNEKNVNKNGDIQTTASAMALNAVIINLSIIGRKYSLDAQYLD